MLSVNTTFLIGNYSKLNMIELKLIPLKEALYTKNIFLYLGSYLIILNMNKNWSKNRKFSSYIFFFLHFQVPSLSHVVQS